MMDLFYLAVLGGVLGISFKGSRWAIAAMAFVLPISRRLPSLPIPLLNTENIIVLVPLVVHLVSGARGKDSGKLRFAFPLLFFTVLVTISLANSLLFFEPTRYFMWWRPYTLLISYKNFLTCFVIYVLGCVAVKDREDLDVILKGLGAGMAFESLFVCLEVLVNGPARANGHLFEANSAGAYLAWVMLCALGVFLVLGFRDRIGRMSLGTTVASGIGLLFTLSRGNWIAAAAGVGLVTLLRDRRALIAIALLFALSPWWTPDNVKSRFDETFVDVDSQTDRFRRHEDSEEAQAITEWQNRLLGEEGHGARLDSSSQIRLFIWQAGLQMMRDYPLGVGYGVFPFYLGDYSTITKFKAAHNSYLEIGAEVGILGLLTFLLFIALLMRESWIVYRSCSDPLMKGLGLAAFGSTLAMAVSAFFYNFWFIIQVNGQQWLLLGLVTQLRRVDAQEIAPPIAGKGPVMDEPVPLYKLVS